MLSRVSSDRPSKPEASASPSRGWRQAILSIRSQAPGRACLGADPRRRSDPTRGRRKGRRARGWAVGHDQDHARRRPACPGDPASTRRGGLRGRDRIAPADVGCCQARGQRSQACGVLSLVSRRWAQRMTTMPVHTAVCTRGLVDRLRLCAHDRVESRPPACAAAGFEPAGTRSSRGCA